MTGQTIRWEAQNLADEIGITSGSIFSDTEESIKLTVSWDSILDNHQSTFEMVPQYGADFLSFEQDMQGGETGYLTLGFDKSMQHTNDYL